MGKVITKLWKNIKRVLYRHVVQPSNWKIRGSHVYVEQCCCVSHSQTVIYYRYSLPSRRSNFRGTGYKLFMPLFHVPLYFRWKGPLSSTLKRGKYVSFPSLSGGTSFLILIRSFVVSKSYRLKFSTFQKRLKRREERVSKKKKNSTILTNSSLKINFEQKMENNHGKSGEKVYRNSSFGLIKQRIWKIFS